MCCAMNLARQLAEALRQMRKDADITQTEMARRLGISQPTLARLESAGQNTTLKTLTQVCRALRCTVGALFEGRVRLSGRSSRGGS
jgi:transcriptional regulator with XRE-family HTH domain